MIREWLRKWLGLSKGKILLFRQNGIIVRAFIPRECQIDLSTINQEGGIITYSGDYGPIEIEDIPIMPPLSPMRPPAVGDLTSK